MIENLYAITAGIGSEVPPSGPWCNVFYVLADSASSAALKFEQAIGGKNIKLVQRMEGDTSLLTKGGDACSRSA